MEGSPILLELLPQLTAQRGKLLSARPELGYAVHAASFIRKRRIVLESELLHNPAVLRLILAHELFHFAWVRLNNAQRRGYLHLVSMELNRGARGELGESSVVAKQSVAGANWFTDSARFKNYVCESFCDTGAWLYGGVQTHSFFSLAKKWQKQRAAWFATVSDFRV